MRRRSLLFTVGPVEMDDQVLKSASIKLPYFRTDEFSEINMEIVGMMKNIAYTSEDSEFVMLTSSGSGAMEAAVINTFTKKDKLIIVNGGIFAQRFVEICKIHRIPYVEIKLDMGKTLKIEQLRVYSGKNFTGLLTNAHETSTGVYYDLPMIGQFCKEEKLIFVVDAISSFLADPYYMDGWNIDITVISSQKGLAIYPGLSFLLINKKAMQKIKSTSEKCLYFNVKNYLKNIQRGQTPYTPAIGVVLQLHSRLKQVKKVGVENIIRNTENIAHMFRKEIKGLPFLICSEKLSNALTPLMPCSNASADSICKHLRHKYNIFLNPNGGDLKRKLFRVGHMGNLTAEDNMFLISAFKKMKKEALL